jgi:hypothetical protein
MSALFDTYNLAGQRLSNRFICHEPNYQLQPGSRASRRND